jgi:hypothetical protein
MKALLCLGLFIAALCPARAADTGVPAITLDSPKDYQVFQRQSRLSGTVILRGHLANSTGSVEVQLDGTPLEGALPKNWQPIATDPQTHAFIAEITVPSGGWYAMTVRVNEAGKSIAEARVEHVGVGEVFVVAGQSNSTNYGSEKQQTHTGHVATFDGSAWRIANDPQPGVQDNSKNGSFLPSFGDALYDRYKVPIGVASCGHGATSVRQWLMKGEKIAVHPTTNAFVKETGPNQWECTGQLYDGLLARIGQLGPHGFRAVLWHQGESDAGQARAGYPAERQITGDQYRTILEKIIGASRKQAVWEIPWFVAQATYHSERDPSDAEFRQAQKAIWEDGFAQPGPDTDTLRAEYRKGVHLNPRGLKKHGELWAEKVGIYLDKVLAAEPTSRP